MSELVCFVCDGSTSEESSDGILRKLTKTSGVSFANIISTLISDEFVLIVSEEDVVCERCVALVDRLDRLQQRVESVRLTLSTFLSKKYNISFNQGSNEEIKKQESIDDVCKESSENEDKNDADQPCMDASNNDVATNGKTAKEDDGENNDSSSKLCVEIHENDGVSMEVSIDGREQDKELEDDSNLTSDVFLNENTDSQCSYFMCDLCQALVKTEEEFELHVCQQNDSDLTLSDMLAENDETEISEKGDNVIEITIVDSKESKVNNLNLKCFICDKVKSSRRELAVHVLSHYPVNSKGIRCPVCNADFITLLEFMNHYDSHAVSKQDSQKRKKLKAVHNKSDDKDSLICQVCKHVGSSKEDLKSHLKLSHNVYPCLYCEKEFPSDLKIKEHLIIHEAKVGKNQCEYCLIKFKSAGELEDHIDKAHGNIKQTKACPVCRKQCLSGCAVRKHVVKRHLIPVLQQEIRENYSHGSDIVNDMKSLGASEELLHSMTDVNKSNSVEGNLKQFKMILNVEASDINFCLLCGFTTKSKNNLDRHREKHSSKNIPCPLDCEQLSCDSEELRSHLSESHDFKTSDSCCPHCLSIPAEDITLHMKALHSKFYTHLSCFVCKDMFFTRENLKDHFTVTHLITSEQNLLGKEEGVEVDENSMDVDDPKESGETSGDKELDSALETIRQHSPGSPLHPHSDIDTAVGATCIYCRKECSSQEDLLKHMSKHSSVSEDIDCPFCSESLHDQEHLRHHMVGEHPLNVQNYCMVCSKSFPSRNSFTTHLSQQCPDRTCTLCCKVFPGIRAFVQHLAYGHRNTMNCMFCKKLCKSLKHLKYHENIHIRYKGASFKCDDCGKVFTTPGSLRSHAISHSGNYPFVCEFCGRGFVSNYGLNEHLVTHTGDVRYCCELCGKSFKLYNTYHKHRNQHDDPFPAECCECGKRFRNTSRLAEHRRKVHTGEKPYSCPYCPMKFNISSTYRMHLCQHTQIFPYNCEICPKGFTSRFKFGNHMAQKHNDTSIVKPSSGSNNHIVTISNMETVQSLS